MNADIPVHIEARRPDQLASIVTSTDEFIAQMKGLRKAAGLSQCEVDDLSGLQDGYAGKLEVGIRHAIHRTFWLWVLSLAPGIVIPPKGSAINPNQCPCCGGPVYLRY